MEENKEPIISQPTDEEQRDYVSLRDNDATVVRILGTKKTYKLRWVKKGQLVKLSRLLVHKGDTDNADKESEDVLNMIIADSKLACKASAIYILDGYWKLLFLYPFLWRWFYYVKQYDDIQLKELLEEGKGGLCVGEVHGQITAFPITEVLSHKHAADSGIYEDAKKLR